MQRCDVKSGQFVAVWTAQREIGWYNPTPAVYRLSYGGLALAFIRLFQLLLCVSINTLCWI